MSDTETIQRTKIVKAPRLDAATALEQKIVNARQEAEQIIQNAKIEAESIKRNAVKQGRIGAIQIMTDATLKIDADMNRIRSSLPSLVMQCMRKIMAKFDHAELASWAAARALDDFDQNRKLILRLAPEQVEIAKKKLSTLPSGNRITVASDPKRDKHSALLETPYGDIALDVESQLQALSAAFHANLSSAQNNSAQNNSAQGNNTAVQNTATPSRTQTPPPQAAGKL